MAPPKAAKSKETPKFSKPLEKTISKTKKKKKNYHNYSIYLFKLLRTVTQNKFGITKKSMLIMNNFVYDMLEKIACEAGRLVSLSKRNTLSSREILTAAKLVLPGELAKHANMEAVKALTMYHNSKEKE